MSMRPRWLAHCSAEVNDDNAASLLGFGCARRPLRISGDTAPMSGAERLR